MKAYVINLPEAEKRRKAVSAMLLRLQIPFELFTAVNGRNMPLSELEQRVDMEQVRKYPQWLTPGMLGAAMSHLEVYRKVASGNDEVVLVLEDDIVLDKPVKKLLAYVEQHAALFSDRLLCLYLVDHRRPIPLSRRTKTSMGDHPVYEVAVPKGVAGAGGYIIHREVAKRFVATIERVRVAPDSWNHFKDLGIYNSIWCAYPFLGCPGLFESTIGYVRNPIINKVKGWVERFEIPVFYQLLKRNRKKIWERTSRVELV